MFVFSNKKKTHKRIRFYVHIRREKPYPGIRIRRDIRGASKDHMRRPHNYYGVGGFFCVVRFFRGIPFRVSAPSSAILREQMFRIFVSGNVRFNRPLHEMNFETSCFCVVEFSTVYRLLVALRKSNIYRRKRKSVLVYFHSIVYSLFLDLFYIFFCILNMSY